MKSMPKLLRRFVGILLLASVLLIILNLILLFLFTVNQTSNAHPWKTAEEVANELSWNTNGYILSEELALELKETDVWGIFIDNVSMKVVWRTDNLPPSVPVTYSAADIANLTRGYIDGYPTFTGEAQDGLVVLGYPRESFWKHMWPSWDYQFIANFPNIFLKIFIINIVFVFIIYVSANTRLLKSVKPIVDGIQSLPTKEAVYVSEKGVLSELAVSINKTSEILQSQNNQLRKRETARANWIAGVSHDIRTPLSMVMGYAGQLENEKHLPEEDRKKAEVIVRQSQRIKNLIQDLNLASKLEYNMQPINVTKQNLIAVVRQVAVDFMNMDIEERHPILWETEGTFTVCLADIDRDLIKRAVSNLIQNCINHNEQGCHIYVCVTEEDGKSTITVADDGVGASEEQIEKLNHLPHYMVCDENTTKQRHGLGLLIVRQIMSVHNGITRIGRSPYGGFSVQLILPTKNRDNEIKNLK